MRAKAAELASLRQSSPPKQSSGLGRSPARRRQEMAPEAGAFFFPSPSGRGQGEGNLDGLSKRCRSD